MADFKVACRCGELVHCQTIERHALVYHRENAIEVYDELKDKVNFVLAEENKEYRRRKLESYLEELKALKEEYADIEDLIEEHEMKWKNAMNSSGEKSLTANPS